MKDCKKVLLLTGSPKGSKGVSDFIGTYFLDCFKKKGLRTRKEDFYNIFRNMHEINRIISYVADSDILLFSCPLYFDGIPYPVIKVMETLVEFQKKIDATKKQKFFAILNCGYPEAEHNITALPMYRQFIAEIGLEWVGSLIIGMGPFVNISSFFDVHFLLKNFKKITERITNTLFEDNRINKMPDLVLEPFIPIWLYSFGEYITARFFAAKNGIFWKIGYRPYDY